MEFIRNSAYKYIVFQKQIGDFIQKINELTDKYKIEIPKGAGPKVNDVAKEIIQKYGIDELNNIAKLNFKNTEEIKK